MTPLDVNLRHLIEQLDADLADADALTKVTEAQQRARSLSGIGDQLIDHFVQRAREGGTSWSQLGEALGVSKQAAQQRWVPGKSGNLFSRFTDRARHVVVLAEARARELRHGRVDTEHMLAGLVGEEEGIGAQAVFALAGSKEAVERALGPVLAPGTDNPPAHVPFTDLNKQVFKESLNVALEMGHNYIGTEHILLGLLRVPSGKAAQILEQAGVTYQAAHAELIKRIDAILTARRAEAKQAGGTGEGGANQAEGAGEGGAEQQGAGA
ncbi:Clp protease N-terminal domain-containing protein [Rugosimonospora africana]|uniref:Clp R domain-containing protein n=1 Tax=Rugosimonospora africana TaxID=556532 RepID=A0A8J3QXM9_9ACTN|nr:Clp protease N-terminal domain-containing protein [Rugosimonospora africana]GIH18753.1 hypothetical protein Raf01_69250 [Rugosimonospora africana]